MDNAHLRFAVVTEQEIPGGNLANVNACCLVTEIVYANTIISFNCFSNNLSLFTLISEDNC